MNKYWNNRKKVEWLNKHFESQSDRNWGRYWYYLNEEGWQERVAYLPEETQGLDGLQVYYKQVEKAGVTNEI